MSRSGTTTNVLWTPSGASDSIRSRSTSMPQLIDRSGARADRFAVVRDGAVLSDLPPGPVIVPLALWLAARDALLARGDVGVWLAPADDPAQIAVDVALLPVIAVDFPAFADGRGY